MTDQINIRDDLILQVLDELKKQNDKLQTDLTKFKEIAAKRLEAMNNLTEKINESEEKKEVI